MSAIGNTVGFISDINPNSSSATQQENLGTLGYDRTGRAYRYALAGAVALVTGNLLQQAVRDIAFTDMTVVSGAAGSNTIVVTLGATATTANQFVGGTLAITVTPGLGQTFTIKSHTVTTGAGAATFTVEESIVTALTTSSKVTVTPNLYSGVIQSPTTRTGKTVGVAQFAIPIANYGWVGTQGVFSVLGDAVATVIGSSLSPSTTVAGAVTKQVTLLETVGTASLALVSGEAQPVYIMIP